MERESGLCEPQINGAEREVWGHRVHPRSDTIGRSDYAGAMCSRGSPARVSRLAPIRTLRRLAHSKRPSRRQTIGDVEADNRPELSADGSNALLIIFQREVK